jgi:hypothetical protein
MYVASLTLLSVFEDEAKDVQHLGALLVAQSRRMNLFQQPGIARSPTMASDAAQERNTMDSWRYVETRKRLAFGIMRADVYTSVLLNSRPLLSPEEVNLTVPQSERLWHNEDKLTPREQLLTLRIESGLHNQILFSDLLRIMFERDERAPLSQSIGHELCLFGMQSALWRFSHDVELFPRLSGTTWSAQRPSSRSTAMEEGASSNQDDTLELDPIDTMDSDNLGQVHRNMSDLHSDRDRVEQALAKWHDSFQASRKLAGFTKDRDSLMSSLLLWNISHLKLHAPLAQLHDISYRAGEKCAVSDGAVKQVREWAETRSASMATEKALAICDLISRELSRSINSRACFNFLAFGGLHHATVVLWTMSELGGKGDFSVLAKARTTSCFASRLDNGDTCSLLLECSKLFKDLSSIGGGSFGTAAEHLSKSQFPAIYGG